VPVSGDRLIPESITDDEVEISGGVPTERVDLGADLREESSAAEDEDELPSFLESTDESESDEEASTTVLPARGFTSGPIIDDSDDAEGVPTDRIETDSSEEAETRVVDHVDPEEAETRVVEPRASDDEIDPGDAETTVLPARSAREMSRERLQAQAEIERQARERLRRQRERNNRRFNDPEGS
jgi:dTMP kinase